MERKYLRLLLTVVMLVMAFNCRNCNTQQIRKTRSIQSNAVTRVENSQSVVDRDSRSVHRFRRELLSDAEKQEVLDAHNTVRRMEGASNMEKMNWNNELASTADVWATNCIWNRSNYPNLGENLYAISGTFTINLTIAIMAWYNEKSDYNYDTLACNSNKICIHYTQVVWATSWELGCAYARCPTLHQSTTTNATFLVCNYRPGGNVDNVKPFLKGTPCSNCPTRSWWCNYGLCDRSCNIVGPGCECAPACVNYVSIDNATCSCNCEPGWYGSDCSRECKDYDPMCNPPPGKSGYDLSSCTNDTVGFYIREKCPGMCKQCQVLNQTDTSEALDIHNALRRLEGASNMEIMTWNNDLATMADGWARNCQWKHGQPSPAPSTLTYKDLGQNLYAIGGAQSINITSAVLDLYNEKPYFNYDILQCQPGQMCGHYTQVVWATSRELGCAYANCSTLYLSNMTNALFLVCNYGPAGNIVGTKPYQIGTACSNCASGSWWCNEGLCDRSCTMTGPTCECKPVCQNSGTRNNANCSCSCAPGWHGSDCSAVCKDINSTCNPQPGQFGWPPYYCTHSEYGPTTREYCPAMCSQCQALGNNYSTSTKPSLLSMLATWLSLLLLYSFSSI